MPVQASPPPANPDIKRELKQQLLSMSARSFEFFAGDFLVYAGLEVLSVTRYIGDGGIDAHGNLLAGRFRIPIGIQVKRHRNNVQRPDIDKFITNPLERFLIKNFIEYFPDEGVLQIAPQLWHELRHYEVMDALKSADEQISYYLSRHNRGSISSP